MGKQVSLRNALEQTRVFLRSLSEANVPTDMLAAELVISDDEKGITFSGPEAASFRKCLDALCSAMPRPDFLTKKGTEKLLKNAVLAAIQIEGNQIQVPEAQIKNAIIGLETALTSAAKEFGVYIPVVGLDPDGLPIDIGQYRFMLFDEREYRKFTGSEVGRHPPLILERSIGGDFLGTAVGYRVVEALEADAARDTALVDLRATIDAINFYSDLVPYNHAHLSLPGDRDGAGVTIPVLNMAQEHRYSISRQRVGRLGHFSLKKLLEANDNYALHFEKVCELLNRKRNEIENVLLASIRWAGRATASSRNEDALLLYVIALESLVLADQDPRELSYRLRLRTACLLGNELEARQEISKRISDLYTIRSNIVHNGRYEVSDADLSSVKTIVQHAILHICHSEEFWKIQKRAEFGSWLESKILS
jgi:hypothetical protein